MNNLELDLYFAEMHSKLIEVRLGSDNDAYNIPNGQIRLIGHRKGITNDSFYGFGFMNICGLAYIVFNIVENTRLDNTKSHGLKFEPFKKELGAAPFISDEAHPFTTKNPRVVYRLKQIGSKASELLMYNYDLPRNNVTHHPDRRKKPAFILPEEVLKQARADAVSDIHY